MFDFPSLQRERDVCLSNHNTIRSQSQPAEESCVWDGGGLEILETRLRNRDPNCKVM